MASPSVPPPAAPRRLWDALALAALLYVVLAVTGLAGRDALRLVLLTAMLAGAALLCLRRARAGADGRAWALLGAGALCWAAAEVVHGVQGGVRAPGLSSPTRPGWRSTGSTSRRSSCCCAAGSGARRSPPASTR